MIWNYTNNRPFGECRELTISPKLFKAEVEKWVSEQKEQELISAAGEQSLNAALESVGYDLHQFMWNHAYNMISDAKLREYFVVYMCLSYSSSQKIIPYNTVENRLMGDVDILTKSHDMRWGDTTTVSDMDIYCRLYFCETEKDVFDIFADGIGNIDELYSYFVRNDKAKALEALLYIYNNENKFLKETTGKSFKTCPTSVKEKIVSTLIDDYFGGMDDDFFDEKNIEQAKSAWNTGILEIRQEFVRDDHTLNILKQIL